MNGPPLHVQLARLLHGIETVHVKLREDDPVGATRELDAVKRLVSRMQEEAR